MTTRLREQLIRHEGKKECCTCRATKPFIAFHRNRVKKDGLAIRCKECHRQKNLESRRRHADRVNENNRHQYHKHKDRHRATQRAYERRFRELAKTDKVKHARLLFDLARSRARKLGVPFTIKPSDIIVPNSCPVLGITLSIHDKVPSAESATVDRIEPQKGYVPGNIIVVSMKANLIKNNATADEIIRVGMFYREVNENVFAP